MTDSIWAWGLVPFPFANGIPQLVFSNGPVYFGTFDFMYGGHNTAYQLYVATSIAFNIAIL